MSFFIGLPFIFIDIPLKIKGTFLAAIFIFEVGSLICALASSSTVLIVGRAIAGIGVGGLFSGALVIIAHTSLYHALPLHPTTHPLISASSEATNHLWAIGRHVWVGFGCWSPTRRRIHRPSLMAMVFLYQASIL